MVDKQGVRSPLYLFSSVTSPDGTQTTLIADLFERRDWANLTEHGHRLVGWFVGLCCIVLAVGLTLKARGALYRSLGWIALLAVSTQGILGALRVHWHGLAGPDLACLHGCLAQLVFAILVAVALLCSFVPFPHPPAPSPKAGEGESDVRLPSPLRGRGVGGEGALRRAAVGLCLLIYAQVVLGALLRHLLDPIAHRLHIFLAFVVVIAVLRLFRRVQESKAPPSSRRLVSLLAVMVILQPVFGIEAWIHRFGSGRLPDEVAWSLGTSIVRSGHHVLGTLIFATAVGFTVLIYRRPAVEANSVLPARQLESVA